MDRVAAHRQFQTILKHDRRSVTNVRKTLFDILLNKEPQYMHDIIAEVGSAVDRASVYRTVDLFEKLGIVERLNIGWKYKLELSDAFSDHHHHITCNNCGKVLPLEDYGQLEDAIKAVASKARFDHQSHQVEIRGLCPVCQLKK